MENNRASRPPLGPLAGSGSRPLSEPRLRILERLRDQPEPVTQAALVTATGLHENTVREHLDALLRRGLVRRFKAEPVGRGRPAWLYEAAGEPATSEYAALATVLAGTIARTSDDPAADALAAGEEWGRDLILGRVDAPPPPGDTDASRNEVVVLLEGLGFAPRQETGDPSVVRLTRCPLLEAAHRHPDVVCGVHLGIVRGALEGLGASPDGTALTPFAEPGACRLVVPPLPDQHPDTSTPTSRSSR